MLKTLCVVIVAALLSVDTAAGDEAVVTTDLLRIRTVSSIDVAQDGSKAVFAVRSIDIDDADDEQDEPSYAYRSHLFMIDLSRRDAQPQQLTFGKRNDSSPRLSPDGRTVAFLRKGEQDDAKAQLWLLRLAGGEARQVTEMKRGVGSPQWSPDGEQVLVASQVSFDELDGTPRWPLERPQRDWSSSDIPEDITPRPDGTREQIRAWLAKNAQKQNPNVITRLDFQDEQKLSGEMRFRHLFLVDVTNDNASPQQVTSGFYDHRDARFMPSGRQIVYVAKKPENEHPDRVRTSGLWMINTDGSDDTQVLAMDGWRLRSPRPDIDGSSIAFTAQQIDEPAFRQWRLGILALRDTEDMEPVWLTEPETFDFSVRSPQWMHARAGLVFTTAREGGFPLMLMTPGLIEPTALVDEQHGMPVGVQRFGVGGGAVVYSMSSPQNPCVLRVQDARSDRLVMDLNAWTAGKQLSMPSENWLTRPDGTRVQYWIMEPTGREEGKQYPLALQIHGGPSAMWGPGEASMWHEFQLLCSWGYGVVYANPRGSGGYGYAFQRGNYQNWGDGPAGDVLAAADEALLEPWVDQERLVVTGGSYAGYLTAWIVGHDHRFKAAVAQRGVYHLPTFFGEGNAWRLVPDAMGGAPTEARVRQVLERESPFTYAHRIRTPLLIMHASNDLRTGVTQSEMLYRALKYLKRPVEYIRYPNAGHDLSRTGDPKQRMDRLNRIVEFFERHIDNPHPAPGTQEQDDRAQAAVGSTDAAE